MKTFDGVFKGKMSSNDAWKDYVFNGGKNAPCGDK